MRPPRLASRPLPLRAPPAASRARCARVVPHHFTSGTILAAERIHDGTAVNLGTMERIRVRDAVDMVVARAGYAPRLEFLEDMPTGPYNRVADNALAKKLHKVTCGRARAKAKPHTRLDGL